ncbi:MAG: efflux RND transporter periplasmic adaptor subunit [Janthinobacterium lividum]
MPDEKQNDEEKQKPKRDPRASEEPTPANGAGDKTSQGNDPSADDQSANNPSAKNQQGDDTQQNNQPAKQDRSQDKDSDHAQGSDKDQNSEDGQEGDQPPPKKPILGWLITGVVVLLAAVVAIVAITRAVVHPRTDDAEVFANFIGMAPQVDGPIMQLPVQDNQYVKAGNLLFIIDERPYRYALERALSNQAALEGQIEDRRRYINSQISGVHVARANILSSAANRNAMASTITEAQADVANAKAAVSRADADRRYAEDNLHRLEPLLAQQFVTVDQVDQARTLLETRTRAVEQFEAQLDLAEARVNSNQAHFEQSGADVEQRQAQRDQAANSVETLDPLTNQREERAAAVRLAQYNLNNCRVYAPFDGYITNLTTSLGAYVHTGTQVFTMIDARNWWVIANFRETQLKHVAPGSAADVFLMSREDLPLKGTVESIGYGVTPDPSVAGAITPGLPTVQRSLSWVHLAARYPVRIRIDAPPPSLLRIGQTAVTVVYPLPGAGR